MSLRRIARPLAAALVAAFLLPAAVPAWAASPPNRRAPVPGKSRPAPNTGVLPRQRGLVPANVSVAGRDLGGLTEIQARSVVFASVRASALPPLTVIAAGETYTMPAEAGLCVDTEAMLDQAYSANGTDPVELTPLFCSDWRAIRSFVTGLASRIDRGSQNARWYLSGKTLKLQVSKAGRRTDVAAGRQAVLDALEREARTGLAQPPVEVPVSTIAPRITEKNVGRAILVVLSERYLRLFDPAKGGSILHGYHCAIGQPEYPTPTGAFRIIEKRYMPTWVNPGSGWARSMPPYIGPGPGNPLGTRALNLSADGIRIHGTENIGSIGTPASHGCIRLVRRDIEQLYDLVVVGTPVFIIK